MATSRKSSLPATFEQEHAAWRKAYDGYRALFSGAEKERRVDCARARRAFDVANQIFDRAIRLMPNSPDGMRDYLDMVQSWDISESPTEIHQSLGIFRRWVDLQAEQRV